MCNGKVKTVEKRMSFTCDKRKTVQKMEIVTEKTNYACDLRKLETPLDEKKELAEDGFYEKLTKFNDSMPSLYPWNMGVRKGKCGSDLYLLYKEVTKRGGFYQVKKDEMWDEVESALNLRSSESMLPEQLQKVYEIQLLPFEQAYWKMTDKSNPCPDTTSAGPSSFEAAQSFTTGNRKQSESSSPLPYSGTLNCPEEEIKITKDTCDVNKVRKTLNSTKRKRGSSNSVDRDREVKKECDFPPMKPRTGHHIFLRLECHRLKMIHGENSGNQKVRSTVLNAWNSLSKEGKKPYNDASKLDKERYEREMKEYSKRRGKNENDNSNCSRDDNDPCSLQGKADHDKRDHSYRVSFQQKTDREHITSEKAMKNAVQQKTDREHITSEKTLEKAMKNAESSDRTFLSSFT